MTDMLPEARHESGGRHVDRLVVRRFAAPLISALVWTTVAASSSAAQPASTQIGLGKAYTFRSAILDEDRELQISLPETYNRTTIAYPVLFVLDGSSHLLHASATARFLAAARNRIPELIVVAIPNTNRNRDMTPGPGATTFQRVLAEELLPWVERHLRAAPHRLVVGHSLSASFVVHTLLNRPELFDTYIAASAPLWRYDNLTADMRDGLPRSATAGTALYLTVGEHENERLREGVKQFATALERAPRGHAPAWSYTDMKDEDHSSTPQRSLYDALEARYADWRFPFFENTSELEQAGGLPGLEAHYRRVSSRFGYQASPPEARLFQVARIYREDGRHDDLLRLADAYAVQYPAMAEGVVNQVGYDQLQGGHTDRAVQTFKRNVEAFPQSPNVHDSLGDAYCRASDVSAAGESYRRAARVAEAQAPPHPRLDRYRKKGDSPCTPTR